MDFIFSLPKTNSKTQRNNKQRNEKQNRTYFKYSFTDL